nr:MAG TPA: hypothetical protein [Caudoviricetes sp.]
MHLGRHLMSKFKLSQYKLEEYQALIQQLNQF